MTAQVLEPSRMNKALGVVPPTPLKPPTKQDDMKPWKRCGHISKSKSGHMLRVDVDLKAFTNGEIDDVLTCFAYISDIDAILDDKVDHVLLSVPPPNPANLAAIDMEKYAVKRWRWRSLEKLKKPQGDPHP